MALYFGSAFDASVMKAAQSGECPTDMAESISRSCVIYIPDIPMSTVLSIICSWMVSTTPRVFDRVGVSVISIEKFSRLDIIVSRRNSTPSQRNWPIPEESKVRIRKINGG
uniref:IP13547p n=1 Tax=Drosophila melanogaster TaxID=7227 RepID=Q4V564_DROME|nr:IP13547p [Drosophila melanogaster]